MAINTLPTLTDEQKLANLKKASQARHERGEAKAALKSGAMSIAEALDDARLQRAKVFEVLRSIPGIGKTKAEVAMQQLGISPSRRVKGLGRRQREAIIERFGK